MTEKESLGLWQWYNQILYWKITVPVRAGYIIAHLANFCTALNYDEEVCYIYIYMYI